MLRSAFLLSVLLAGNAAAEPLAIRAGKLFPVSGAPVEDAVVLVRDGKIERIARRAPAGYRVLEAAVVTPGLVDVRSVAGMAGIYNSDRGQVRDQDQLERSEPLQPELRAIDAYDPLEPLVGWLTSLGVTTLHTGHGPGAAISGQTLVAKTGRETVGDAVIRPTAALAATLGPRVSGNFDSPGTRAKTAAVLREAFLEARTYADKRRNEEEAPDRNLRLEALADALEGDVPLMIAADTAADIATALRLQREFGFTLWLDGAAEAYRMIEPIRDAGVPVLLHATMIRAVGDRANAAFSTAADLDRAGIEFAIQSGYEPYVPKTRVILYEAQVAVHAGLAPAAALEAITLAPARILGLDDRIGSIDAGKDADLVLFDGDPFEYTSHVCGVIVEGRVVSETCR